MSARSWFDCLIELTDDDELLRFVSSCLGLVIVVVVIELVGVVLDTCIKAIKS